MSFRETEIYCGQQHIFYLFCVHSVQTSARRMQNSFEAIFDNCRFAIDVASCLVDPLFVLDFASNVWSDKLRSSVDISFCSREGKNLP